MSEIASLYAKIGADVTGLQKGLGQAKSGLSAFGKELGSSLAGALGLQLSLAGLAAGAVGAAGEMLRLGASFEQTEVAFTTLLGSGKEATAFLDDLRSFAASTPFQFSDLTDASRRLLAFGFAAEQVIPMMTNIGNAVAAMGGNAQMVDRVTLAIGQMSAKGKVSAGEMLQLTEAGIPAWRYLAEAMGLSTAEVMKLSERGLIPATVAIDALMDGMKGDFGGMMAEQAQTAAGQMSNLTDKLEALGTTIGTKLLPTQNAFVGVLSEAAGSAQLLVTWNDQVTAAYQQQATSVEQSVTTYRQYVEQIGILSDGEREHYLALIDSGAAVTEKGDSIESLAQLYGIYTEAEFEAVRAEYDAANAQRAHAAETERWTGLAASYVTAAGKMSGAISLFGGAVLDSVRAMDVLKESVGGAVGKENKDFESQQSSLAEEIAKVQGQLAKYQSMTGQTVTVQREATNSQAEYELALLNAGQASDALSEAQRNLAENTDPAKQDALAEAALRAQVAMEKAQAKADEMGKGVGGSETITTDYSTKIEENKKKLDELSAKYAENAAAHEDATKRILFGYLMQEAAVGGFSDREQIALAAVAQKWGLLDGDTQTAQLSMIGAIQKLGEGGSWEAFFGAIDTAKDKVLGLGGVITGLPDQKNISINVSTNGYVPNMPGANGAPNTPIPLADGFQGMVTSPTLFLVGEAGPEYMSVVPAGQTGAGMAAGISHATGGGVTNVITWSGDIVVNGGGDPQQAAREVVRALQDRGILSMTALR